MKQQIIITKKNPSRGDDGHKVISIRMKNELIEKLDDLALKTNRSRNELVNLLLEESLKNVTVKDD
ncbi:MAG: ribbon-helix-helix protein, CopG family [Clostridia bacterium]|nr:ribbon-helix-helix protein, CopG family [Clostridia bacterium]